MSGMIPSIIVYLLLHLAHPATALFLPSVAQLSSNNSQATFGALPICAGSNFGTDLNIKSCEEAVALLRPSGDDPDLTWGKRGGPWQMTLPKRYLSCKPSVIKTTDELELNV